MCPQLHFLTSAAGEEKLMCKQDRAQIWIFLVLHVSIPPPVVTRQRRLCPGTQPWLNGMSP